MPYKSRMNYRRRPNRRRRRPRAGLATRPRMMSNTLALKRMNQVSTKCFYFKRNGIIQPNLAGTTYEFWTTRSIESVVIAGWTNLKTLYDQYKVLAIKLKLFPANVGIESDTAFIGSNGLLRGDTCVWSDQRYDANAQVPTLISQVINNASTRMINSRRSYNRTLYRPKGNPGWGQTNGPPTPDSWNGSIELIINGATPAPVPPAAAPTLYYYTLEYKVLMRGRTQV